MTEPGDGGERVRGAGMVGTCRVCGDSFDRRRRNAAGKIVGVNRETQTCPRHRWLRRVGEVLVDKETRYQDDVACQLFVATFRGGATLDSIAEALGVSRERVRQIENDAKRKLDALGLRAFNVDPDDPDERRDGLARHDDGDAGENEETPDRSEPAAGLLVELDEHSGIPDDPDGW